MLNCYFSLFYTSSQVMPFPKDVVSQLDYNSRLRLTICFFKMKTMLKAEEDERLGPSLALEGPVCPEGGVGDGRVAISRAKPSLFKPGILQDVMCEV